MDTEVLAQWFKAIPVDQAEAIKLDFASSVDHALRTQGMSRKDLAAALNTSPAWITKVLRGDVNMTIETMAKLSAAIGYELSIHIARKNKPELKDVAA